MTIRVELDQLLSLALGNPEVGAVNFNILHGVLREILNHLGIEKKGKDIGDDGDFRAAFALLKNKQEAGIDGLEGSKIPSEKATTDKMPFSSAAFSAPFDGNLESKVASIEKKLEILDDLPSNGEILQRAKQKKDSRTPVADMWQFININRRLGATETGIEKVRIIFRGSLIFCNLNPHDYKLVVISQSQFRSTFKCTCVLLQL